MDLAFYIYSYLQEQKPIVEVPDFGIFRLVKEHAVVDAESSKILPPSEHIHFEDNTAVFDSSLAHYIAEKTGENLFIIQSEIRDTVREWIKLLMLQKKLNLKYLGELSLKEIDIIREETKIPQSMEFFGLEEVNLSEFSPVPAVKKEQTQKQETKETKKTETQKQEKSNNGIWWVLLFITIAITGLVFLYYNYGKSDKSTDDSAKQDSIQSVQTEIPQAVSPSTADSITIDSVQLEY